MPTPAQPSPFAALLGRWHTTGTVLDVDGTPVAQVEGTDDYTALGGWVVHRVDVRIGGEPVTALELIGGHDPATGTWEVHAFDGDGSRSVMTATRAAGSAWLFRGAGARAHLHVGPDGTSMTGTWERRDDRSGRWWHWMDLDFTRA